MDALARLLSVGSEWGSFAAPIGGGVRRAGKEFAEEASERVGRQAACHQADESAEIAWRAVGEEEMQLIAQTGKFVGSKSTIAGKKHFYTRVALDRERLLAWALQQPADKYSYLVGIPVRKGSVLDVVRESGFADGFGYIVPAEIINRYVIGSPIIQAIRRTR